MLVMFFESIMIFGIFVVGKDKYLNVVNMNCRLSLWNIFNYMIIL